jgi:hypothetical protein
VLITLLAGPACNGPVEPAARTGSETADQLTVVRDGQAAAVIVIPDRPIPVEREAAMELQYHVRKASGAELPIVKESDAPGELPWLALGGTRLATHARQKLRDLPPNSFIIAPSEKGLILAGDDTDGPVGIAEGTIHNNREHVGTLFAVYDLLETQLGCRWLWPGPLGEVIPARRDIALTAEEKTHSPTLIHKRLRDYGMLPNRTDGWARPGDLDRFRRQQARWLRRQRFAMGENLDVQHAFTRWWKLFGKTHPEYFNRLPDGSRRPDPVRGGVPHLVMMCVSNPALHEKIVELWAARRKPGQHGLDVSENDGLGSCTCEACLAMDVPHPDNPVAFDRRLEEATRAWQANDPSWPRMLGSLSDRYARYMLAVQKRAETIDPDVIVLNHAYANYVLPPQNTQLNERVVLAVVPPFHLPWVDEETLARTRAIWDGWRQAGARLLLRPNYMLGGHAAPLLDPAVVADDFQYAFHHGMIGTDYDALTGHYATQGLAWYVLARRHSEPDRPLDDILQEYTAAFGPAAQSVQDYFAFWADLARSIDPGDYDLGDDPRMLRYAYFHRFLPEILTPQRLAESRAILDRALRQTAEQSTERKRVEFLQLGLEHLALMTDVQRQLDAYRRDGSVRPYYQALARLDEFRRERLSSTNVANLNWLWRHENLSWDRGMLTVMNRIGNDELITLPRTWQFRFDPENVGIAQGWFRPGRAGENWQVIGVDGPWETQKPGRQWKKQHGEEYDGYGWYRLTFDLPPRGDPDERYRLVFGAVDEACRIWVNGQQVLDRPYPWQGQPDSWATPFEVDFTEVARPGRPNTVVVRVEDNGGHGGIWKPVHLIVGKRGPVVDDPLVRNGGFEAPTFEPWQKHVHLGRYELAIDPSVAHTGRASGRITGLEMVHGAQKPAAKGWARWIQKIGPLQPGEAYDLSLFLRTDPDFAGQVDIWCLDPQLQARQTARLLSTAGKWVEVRLEDYVPTVAWPRLFINSIGSEGSIWIDDVRLTPSEAP